MSNLLQLVWSQLVNLITDTVTVDMNYNHT